MCGIVGIAGKKEVTSRLVAGLERLEYRGYDSAGIAVHANGIQRRRCVGRVMGLKDLLDREPVNGHVGIAHTRWATHGVPNEANAHPHVAGPVAVVHNGIIENHAELRAELEAKGCLFTSDTDTEVVAHLIHQNLQKGLKPEQAALQAIRHLKGAYALAIIFEDDPNLLIGARLGSPLAIGYSEEEHYLGSDALALAGLAEQISFLEEGDIVVMRPSGVTIYDHKDQVVIRPAQLNPVSEKAVTLDGFEHFMLKEIHEQPAVFEAILSAYTSDDALTLPRLPFDLTAIESIQIIACGTAYHAGLVARYWLEKLARIPVEVEIASEYRYRTPPLRPNTLAIFISQSGETADTLAAQAYAKEAGAHTLAVVNVANSSLHRSVDAALLTLAGPEVGVASTKAFTAQLMVLALLTLNLAEAKGLMNKAQLIQHLEDLRTVVRKANDVIEQQAAVADMAKMLVAARDVLYLGRGTFCPLAFEGALKLKELSYIHAEGYAAGEMKHGPIALIDDHVPVIVIAPEDELFHKTLSNVQEVSARKGIILALTDVHGQAALHKMARAHYAAPTAGFMAAPILQSLPLQFLSYFTALMRGCDVDKPRNLAKSVTVE
ncbi:MAG: glutamine--fructose-6-phosphate transaminase (isomerizing) [Holosporales bacterium]